MAHDDEFAANIKATFDQEEGGRTESTSSAVAATVKAVLGEEEEHKEALEEHSPGGSRRSTKHKSTDGRSRQTSRST